MGHRLRVTPLAAAILLAVVILLEVTSGAPVGWASPVAAKAAKKVTCDQMTDEIDKTAQRFASQYRTMGFNITVAGSFQRCTKLGKRARQGKGYMSASAPIPGENNPNVSEHYYTWIQLVVRTKKGKLRSTVSDFTCERVIPTGSGNFTSGGPC
jgi:hypothetical protein